MSTHYEYLAEWPDGTPVWEEMKSSPAFFQRFDKLCRHLKGLSVPKAYWPVVHVRTVETTTGRWVTWDEHVSQNSIMRKTSVAEDLDETGELHSTTELPRRVTWDQQNIPEGTSNPVLDQSGPKSWGEITPRQIARVRAKRFSLSDPCVICGADFSECPHTMAETELFVQYIRSHYASALRQKP